MLDDSCDVICVVFWRRKKHNLSLLTLKLPPKIYILLRLLFTYYFWRF